VLTVANRLWAQSPPAPVAEAAQAAGTAAQETSIEGWVIAFNPPDVVIDLARAQGVRPQDVVELWRPLKLKHPVTGRIVTDRFRIGTLELVQVRDRLNNKEAYCGHGWRA